MIGQTLERRVEELRGNDHRACERDHRPPERLGTYCDQQYSHERQSDSLISQTAFRAKSFHQTAYCESKSSGERLIFLSTHE